MADGQSSGRRGTSCVLVLAVWCLLAVGPGRAESLTITTLAGPVEVGPGAIDGPGSAARFNYPSSVAVDGSGNVYVGDTRNNTIRKITPGGVAMTFAGTAGTSGNADGPGSAARFWNPNGVAVDGSGNVYVADTTNYTIRKITPAGVATILAGKAGSWGSADGTGSAARFYDPYGVAVDVSGNVYVADTYNHTIRKITPGGVVTTFAGTAGSSGSADGTGSAARFYYPQSAAVDGSGNVYVADTYNHTIRTITPGGVVTTLAGLPGSYGSADGTGSAARFYNPYGVAADGSGTVYVADTSNNTIRKITPGGAVTTLAGSAGYQGSADGTGSAAQFNRPSDVALDGSGNVYVADTYNQTIRKITPAGVVSTVAGLAGSSGSADGTGSAARFLGPGGVAVDGSGNVYVADTSNNTIRKITPGGAVTTLAGLAGYQGGADGTGSAARFTLPNGVAVDGLGNVYAADTINHTIRKVTPAGVVSTLAGLAGSSGSADGTGGAARFYRPCGVAVDGSGNVYVGDTDNYTIRKITPAGVVSTLAGLAGSSGSADGTGSAARFKQPSGVAVDGSGNLYVADSGNNTIRKTTPGGAVTTLAGSAGYQGSADGTGSAARFSYPMGLAVDASGNVCVADRNNNTVRKMTPGGVVTTLAGKAGSSGSADGTGSAAQFYYLEGVALDSSGNVYVADTSNNSIRKGVSPLADVATIDKATGPVGTARQLDTSPHTATTWQWQVTRIPAGSSATLSSTSIRNPTFTPDVAELFVFRLKAADASGHKSTTTVQLMSIGPAATLVVSGFPSPATAGTSGSLTVTAKDANGNTAADYTGTVHFTSGDGAAVLPGDYTFVSADSGAHTFSATLKTVGTQTITATDTATSSINGTQSNITVRPAGASSLLVSGFPSPVSAGIAGSFTVTAKDAYGNTATGFTEGVVFSSSDSKAILPASYVFASADSGTHTFSATVLKTAGTQSITVTDYDTPSINGTQSGITVTPAGTSGLVVSGFPSPVTAGTAGNFTVAAIDLFGNTVPGYTGTVRFTSSDGAAVLPGNYTFVSSDSGSHVFSATLKTAGSRSITATDTGTFYFNATQSNITVSPAGVSSLLLSLFSSPVTAGTAGSFAVTAKDAYGNTATGYTGTVHFTGSDPQAALPADYTFTTGNQGFHWFNATLKTAGTQSITATDTATGSLTGTQSGITVNPAGASSLVVSAFPSPVTAGTAGSFTVTAKDAYGNAATGYKGTAHFTSIDNAALLPGDYTFVTNDSGAHTFSATLRTAGTQSITATDKATSSINGTQSGITVSPAAASSLVVSGFPSQVTAGSSGNFSVTVRDAYGNTATDYIRTVHFTSSDGAALLPSNYTFVSSDSGTHMFSATLRTAGMRNIAARDTMNGGISGAQSNIRVNQATSTTTLMSSANPSTYGQFVTFTATVAGASPTGTMAFMDGSTTVGTGTLDGSTATYSTSELAVGEHSITAVYGGDVNNTGSTTAALTQTVKLNQTITFNALPPIVSDAPDFDPGARASSGLAVTYASSNTVVATIVNGMIHLLSAGSTTITASQGGDTNHNPAPAAQQTLTVIPATPLEVFLRFTIPASVSIAWGDGTTGKVAGDATPLDWTVQDATGGQLGHGETCASNDANNNMAINLENTSNTGTNARAFAAVANSGGWNIASAPATDTFAIKAQLGTNALATLTAAAQELTGTATLAKGADQPLILTVMTPTDITRDAGVQKTIFVVLTATPE